MPPTQIVAPNCTPSNVDYNCCTSANPCANGEGDCDDDSDCISGHCAQDVGGNYGAPTIFDVCEAYQAPNCPPSLVDYNCCTSSNPCANGDGDCDFDNECISGYCEHNVGARYGIATSFDVCAPGGGAGSGAVKPNTAAPTVSPTKPPTGSRAPTVSPTNPPTQTRAPTVSPTIPPTQTPRPVAPVTPAPVTPAPVGSTPAAICASY